MTRLIVRTYLPVLAVLLGVVLVLQAVGVLALYQGVRDGKEQVEKLRDQVRSLGGDPDEPPVVNVTVRPPGPVPAASPTTRSERPTAAPASPAATRSSAPPASPGPPSPSRLLCTLPLAVCP